MYCAVESAFMCRTQSGTRLIARITFAARLGYRSDSAPRACPSQDEALELGLKIGTYPTGMLSPSVAGIRAGLAALFAGDAEADSALEPADLRETLGYNDYEEKAKQFTLPD